MSEWVFKTAVELAAAIRERRVTSLELVDAFVERIHALDRNGGGDEENEKEEKTNAVVLLYEDAARKRAREADVALEAGNLWGPLHGIPMTIKECNFWASTQLTGGDMKDVTGVDSADEDLPTSLNEPFVQYLLDAGAILLGKTNLPLGQADWQSYNHVYGQTNNPFNLSKVPGGSSGGSAAALAAFLTPLEVGGDIGGSIRIPAHFCGCFGHKVRSAGFHIFKLKLLASLRHVDV